MSLDDLLKGIAVFDEGVTSLAKSLATRDAAKQVKALDEQVQAQTDNMLQQSMGTMPPEEITKMQQELFQQQTQARGQIAGNLALRLTRAGANAATIEAATSRIGQAPQQLDQMGFQREQLAENARQFDARLGVLDRQADAAMLRAQNTGKAASLKPKPPVDKKRVDKFFDTVDANIKATEDMNFSLQRADQLFQNLVAVEGQETGIFGSFGGQRAKVNEARQAVDRAFKDIGLKNLVATFQGFAKSIDTDAERAAFEAIQLSVDGNLKGVNANILAGLKALNARSRIEIAAQKAYIEESENGTLKGYVSPTQGKSPVFNAITGEIEFVDKEAAKKAADDVTSKAEILSLKGYSEALKQGKVDAYRKAIQADNMVNVMTPNGDVRRIPKNKLDAAIAAGGKAL